MHGAGFQPSDLQHAPIPSASGFAKASPDRSHCPRGEAESEASGGYGVAPLALKIYRVLMMRLRCYSIRKN
jgi:hypothetical protein